MADQDLIEQLTQQAGGVKTLAPGGGVLISFHPADLEGFVALVAGACAEEVDRLFAKQRLTSDEVSLEQVRALGAAIRAKFKPTA